MKEAFDLLSDGAESLPFLEIFEQIEKNHEENSDNSTGDLVYNVLKRFRNFSEVWGNASIDFDTLVELLKKSLNMRQTRKQV